MTNVLFNPPQQRRNNPDDPIGKEIQLDDACIPDYSDGRTVQHLLPSNGEYEYSGKSGTCGIHIGSEPRKMRDSSGCDGRFNCAAVGRNPFYRRKAFSADLNKCCETGATMIGDKTCPPGSRGDARYSSGTCNPYFKNMCQGDAIFSDIECGKWQFHSGDSIKDIVVDLKANACRNKTNHNCGLFCQSLMRDGKTQDIFRQCELDEWQQGFCNPDWGDQIYDDPVCVDYCSITRRDQSASDLKWCVDNRKAKIRETVAKLEKSIKDGFPPGWEWQKYVNSKGVVDVQRYIKEQQDKLKAIYTDPKYGCYLPEQVYTDYATSLKKNMGLQKGRDDVIINYIDANKKCLFPPCQNSEPQYRPFECPPMLFCTQNINVDIIGSTVSGNADVSASQQCLAEIQKQNQCSYDYGEWSKCVNGKQTRTISPKPNSSSTCYSSAEEKTCSLPPSPPPPSETGCSYDYGEWSTCVNGKQTRTVSPKPNSSSTCYSSVEEKTCSLPPPPSETGCSYDYGEWSTCVNGKQTRTVSPNPNSSSTCSSSVEEKTCSSPFKLNAMTLGGIVIVGVILILIFILAISS